MLRREVTTMQPDHHRPVMLNWGPALRVFLRLSAIWVPISAIPYLNDFARDFPNIRGDDLRAVAVGALGPPMAILVAGIGLYLSSLSLWRIWQTFGAEHWLRLPDNVRRGLARLYLATAIPWTVYFGYRMAVDSSRHYGDRYIRDDLLWLLSIPAGAIALFMVFCWIFDGFNRRGPIVSEPPTARNASQADSSEDGKKAIFEKLHFLLTNEKAQVAHLPEPMRSQILGGAACDKIPGAKGEFGRDLDNPIPVNGPLGELIYLSNLLNETSRQPILFHRLGSAGRIDIFETVTTDGERWDILFFDLYHPTKSRLTPSGYLSANSDPNIRLPCGTNEYLPRFPSELPSSVANACERFIGLRLCPPEVRRAIESVSFSRPPAHQVRISSLAGKLAR